MKAKWVVLIVVIVLVVGFVGGVVLHALLTPSGVNPGEAAPPAQSNVSIGADFVLRMVQKGIPTNTGFTMTDLQFAAPNMMAAAGEVEVSSLTGRLTGFTAMLAQLLPKRLSVGMTAALSAENGTIVMDLKTMTFSNLTVGERLIPDSLKQYVSDTVSAAIREYLRNIGEITYVSAGENSLRLRIR